jgi:hypothetical protein
MSDSEGKYTYSSLVVGLHFLLFFLGVFVCIPVENGIFFNYTFVFITFFIGIFVTVGLSFVNRSIIGGFVLGLTQSLAYWIGFLTGVLITGTFGSSLVVLDVFGMYALTVITAFSVTGLFFGLLGYIANHMFFEGNLVESYVFRDYWSNVYTLGKNNKREYIDIDRRLTNIHFIMKDWWKNLIWRARLPKPELVFVPQAKAAKKPQMENIFGRVGDVFDINSGEHLFSEVIDPTNLVATYRPSLLSMPAISNRVGGGRKLALEEVVSRFLGWFIESNYLWALYLFISVLLGFASLNYFREYTRNNGIILLQSDIINIILVCALLSALTIYFVWRFRIISKDLFDKRPDERLLSFSIYLMLVLFYPLYYQLILSLDTVILNISSFFEVGSKVWVIWIEWFSFLTVILGLTYIFIHRESEVSNVYLYDLSVDKNKKDSITPFKDTQDYPFWLESDETSQYWVLRFMYFWRYELTLRPHSDWERVEVWVDAKTGNAKWIVSDYHYRELWYKVEKDIKNSGLILGFLTNFHTPIPFVTTDEVEKFTTVLNENIRNLFKILLTGKIVISQPEKNPWIAIHPPEWIEKFGLTGVAASFCSNLKWSYWRYPWGIDNIEKYSSYPSTIYEEQPK